MFVASDSMGDESVREARARVFATGGIPADGGQSSRWVDFKIGLIPLRFPNFEARKRTVRFHDLHHIATGYQTDWRGEFEISAWEIGSGCAGHAVAWFFNSLGLATGILISPRAVWRAFLRGRHSRNLYRTEWSDTLLSQSVEQLRHSLHLDRPIPRARLSDRLAFAGWVLAPAIACLVP